MRMTRLTLLAVCIAGAVACSDDGDKGGGNTLPDGAMNPDRDSGSNGNIDSGLDSGFIGRDATVLPDGNVIDPTPDSGNPVGPDASQPLPCGGSCNDNIDCTIDTCLNNKCEHRVDNNFCAAGSSCSLTEGCKPGKTCASDSACADTDECTVRERCNLPTATCEHDVLDRDGDGYLPATCLPAGSTGTADCDDTRGTVNPSATETCNNRDDNCDGTVDNVAPVTGYTCSNGELGCAQGWTECGGVCVNTNTDPNNCGGCGFGLDPEFSCGSGGTCTNGACGCTPSATVVECNGPNPGCADITKSQVNCGGCGMTCQPIVQGGQLQSCIASACTPCGRENQACCANGGADEFNGCTGGLTCEGAAGAAGSKCVCGAGSTKCGNACVDLKSSNANCGGCGMACEANERCVTAGATTACEACGGAGELCCAGLMPCRGGRVCGPDNTCVVGNAGGPGGGGPGGPGN